MRDGRVQVPHHEVVGVCFWGGVGGNSEREATGNHRWMAQLAGLQPSQGCGAHG